MKKVKMAILKISGVFTGLFIILVAIHILQNGIGGWNGKTLDELLGKPAAEAVPDDIRNLSKSELMQIFYASPAPDVNTFKGEYKGELIPAGVLSFLGDVFTKYIYGEGDIWVGKGFVPCREKKCAGYNLFIRKEYGKAEEIIRKRKMETYVAASNAGNGISFMIDYSPYNSGLVHIFRDELRRINNELFIGVGYLNFPGGSYISFPFILFGRPAEPVIQKQ